MKSDLRILGYLGVCEWHAGSVWTANHQSQPLFIRLSNKAEPALKNKMRTSTNYSHHFSSIHLLSNTVILVTWRKVLQYFLISCSFQRNAQWQIVFSYGSWWNRREVTSWIRNSSQTWNQPNTFFFLLNYNNLWILGEPPSFTVCTDELQQVRQGVFSQLQSATLPLAVTTSHTLDRKQQHQPPRSNDKLLQR